MKEELYNVSRVLDKRGRTERVYKVTKFVSWPNVSGMEPSMLFDSISLEMIPKCEPKTKFKLKTKKKTI
jgi:hypothetical protein